MSHSRANSDVDSGDAGVSRILSIAVFSAVSMCSMGIPLAVLPLFMHEVLQCGMVLTGFVLGINSLTLLMARPVAGRLGDRVSPKRSVTLGLWVLAGSGLLTWICTLLAAWPTLSLVVLTLGRLLFGFGSGLVNTGTLSWGISVAGPAKTARVISYNGVLAFTSLALSPPIGAALADVSGVWSVGAGVFVLNLLALVWAYRLPTPLPVAGQALSFASVFGRIAPMGATLGLGAAGFAAITTFVTLYFSEQGWAHAAWAMTTFGIAYVGTRLLFTGAVERHGGTRVALACFVFETIGLATLGFAPNAGIALVGAALLGIGQSLIYAALGVEVVASVSPSNRSSALGAFSLCFDLSLILSGPLFGAVAAARDFRSVFLCAAVLALVGLGAAGGLHRRKLRQDALATESAAR